MFEVINDVLEIHDHQLYDYRPSRELSWTWPFNSTFTFFADKTDNLKDAAGKLNASLQPATDVDIDGVRASLYINAIVFVALMLLYECLRKLFPNVYASRRAKETQRIEGCFSMESDNFEDHPVGVACSVKIQHQDEDSKPFQWIKPVLGASWRQIHEVAGLDAYFYLRYIQMCHRITSVTAIWGMLILFPVYSTGTNGAVSWYHFSMANVNQGDKYRIWVPTLFIYIFSGFVFYVMTNELAHYMELRLDFLGKGEIGVNPQQHYSIMLENIPKELRSDRALHEYFNQLFPGKIHSAHVLLSLPQLEILSQRKDRTVRRLEKSIAYYEATGQRPQHITGRPRINWCDIEISPFRWEYLCRRNLPHDMDLDGYPAKGSLVDSIQYYTVVLENANREFVLMQKDLSELAADNNQSFDSNVWFATVSRFADIFIEESNNNGYKSDASDLMSDVTSSKDSNPSINLSFSSSASLSQNLSDDISKSKIINQKDWDAYATLGKKRRSTGDKDGISWDTSCSEESEGLKSTDSREGLSWSHSDGSFSRQNNDTNNTACGTVEEPLEETGDGPEDKYKPIYASGDGQTSTCLGELIKGEPENNTASGIIEEPPEENGDGPADVDELIDTTGVCQISTYLSELIKGADSTAQDKYLPSKRIEEEMGKKSDGGDGSSDDDGIDSGGGIDSDRGDCIDSDSGDDIDRYRCDGIDHTDGNGGMNAVDDDGIDDGYNCGDGSDCDTKLASVCANTSKETIETKSTSTCSFDSFRCRPDGSKMPNMPSALRRYGTLDRNRPLSFNDRTKRVKWSLKRNKKECDKGSDSSQQSKAQPLLKNYDSNENSILKSSESTSNKSPPNRKNREKKKSSFLGRFGLRLGIDFIMYGVKLLNNHICKKFDTENTSRCMSGTGFVTFFDLASVTYAAGVSLSHRPDSLVVTVAPEARDLEWSNAHLSTAKNKRRETTANILLTFGVFFWSIPLALIQALASAEKVAKIPGMGWVLTFAGGRMMLLLNAYLPAVILLSLILVLPNIFEWVAISYEKRKTKYDVAQSVVGRYFYYQLATIYISVTAGSIWKSFGDIMDHPSYFLQILGNSLPTVVGYFISLLVTKVLGGLPSIILRTGALCRYMLLRIMHSKKYLTQRELDEVYRVESLWYAWEYPNQMMVIVICFTYACISPCILIFGAFFFWLSLIIYKKQVIYVYTPEYESGGKLFPVVIDLTIFGLICGQITLIGYFMIRGAAIVQTLSLTPLVYFSYWMMGYFRAKYTEPTVTLTLERAIGLDRKLGTFEASRKEGGYPSVPASSVKNNVIPPQLSFCPDYYKQPALTQPTREPLSYRKGYDDPMTVEARERLARNRYNMWSPHKNAELV